MIKNFLIILSFLSLSFIILSGLCYIIFDLIINILTYYKINSLYIASILYSLLIIVFCYKVDLLLKEKKRNKIDKTSYSNHDLLLPILIANSKSQGPIGILNNDVIKIIISKFKNAKNLEQEQKHAALLQSLTRRKLANR